MSKMQNKLRKLVMDLKSIIEKALSLLNLKEVLVADGKKWLETSGGKLVMFPCSSCYFKTYEELMLKLAAARKLHIGVVDLFGIKLNYDEVSKPFYGCKSLEKIAVKLDLLDGSENENA